MPIVSLITGMHNAGNYLARTVASVLGQSFTEFEYILADDGSTDNCLELLEAVRDPRLRIMELGKVGRSQALNAALAEAKGEFAAILDADDLCLPDRLERQLALFRADPDLTVVGSSCWFIDEDDRASDVYWVPASHACILWQMLFQNPFVHSSAMFRLSAVRALGLAYEADLEPSEDYAFLTTLAWHGKAANDERPLVHYRMHERQLSHTRQQLQMDNAASIHRRNLAWLDRTAQPPERARDWLWGLPVPAAPCHAALLRFYLGLLDKLEGRPHVRAGDLAFLRVHLERDLRAALAAGGGA